MLEKPEIRLKRLKMRSIRRGIKEMDMILSVFAETDLAGLNAPDLDVYETLLDENDHDLYAWVSGRKTAPDVFAPLIDQIAASMDRQNLSGSARKISPKV